MPYTFSVSDASGVLTIRIGGQRAALDSDALEQMWGNLSRAADYCRQHGIRRLVSANTPSGQVSSSSAAAFYSRLGDFGFDLGMRIAVVIPDTQSRRVIELGAALAIERGWNIKVFADEESARDWVMRD